MGYSRTVRARDLDHAVLVVVDVQNGFVNDVSAPVLRRIVPLVRRWCDAGAPVVFTAYHNYPGSQFERLLKWTEVHGPPDTTIVAELQPYLGDATAVLAKTGYSAFVPELDKLVEQHGWTDVVVCGLDTDTCVLKTVADAFERGHTPWLVRDACASHGGRGHHRSGLTLAGRFIGIDQLVTRGEVEVALTARTGRRASR
jgi:nicotinamidase-related amidase